MECLLIDTLLLSILSPELHTIRLPYIEFSLYISIHSHVLLLGAGLPGDRAKADMRSADASRLLQHTIQSRYAHVQHVQYMRVRYLRLFQ